MNREIVYTRAIWHSDWERYALPININNNTVMR